MPYAHRTEFPEKYRQPWNEPRYEMPDGSGPWTVMAWAYIDEPAARGARGRRVEVTEAPHNRRDDYDDEKSAKTMANILNTMVENYDKYDHDDDHFSAIDLATRDGFVDGFEVVLREGARKVR